MVKCSLCGAEGVSKTTCPLNPNSKNPNPSKHNVNKSSNKDSLHNLIDNMPIRKEEMKDLKSNC